jgi:hypothetical protein
MYSLFVPNTDIYTIKLNIISNTRRGKSLPLLAFPPNHLYTTTSRDKRATLEIHLELLIRALSTRELLKLTLINLRQLRAVQRSQNLSDTLCQPSHWLRDIRK